MDRGPAEGQLAFRFARQDTTGQQTTIGRLGHVVAPRYPSTTAHLFGQLAHRVEEVHAVARRAGPESSVSAMSAAGRSSGWRPPSARAPWPYDSCSIASRRPVTQSWSRSGRPQSEAHDDLLATAWSCSAGCGTTAARSTSAAATRQATPPKRIGTWRSGEALESASSIRVARSGARRPPDRFEDRDRVKVVAPSRDLAVDDREHRDVPVCVGSPGGDDTTLGGVLKNDHAGFPVVMNGQVKASVEHESVAIASVQLRHC